MKIMQMDKIGVGLPMPDNKGTIIKVEWSTYTSCYKLTGSTNAVVYVIPTGKYVEEK
jgi:hypothetical protein